MKSKILCITLLIIFCISPLIATAESGNEEYTFENNETTITITGINLTEDKSELIANKFFGISEIRIAPYNLLCIFGHSIETGIVAEIAHNAYSSSPKCHCSMYDIEYCTRSNCDYTGYTLTDSFRIACH